MTWITWSKSTCVYFYTSVLHTVQRLRPLRPFSVRVAGRTQSSGSPTPWCHTYTTTLHCVSLDYHGCSTRMLTARWQVSCWETVLEQDCWCYLTHTKQTGLQNSKWILARWISPRHASTCFWHWSHNVSEMLNLQMGFCGLASNGCFIIFTFVTRKIHIFRDKLIKYWTLYITRLSWHSSRNETSFN